MSSRTPAWAWPARKKVCWNGVSSPRLSIPSSAYPPYITVGTAIQAMIEKTRRLCIFLFLSHTILAAEPIRRPAILAKLDRAVPRPQPPTPRHQPTAEPEHRRPVQPRRAARRAPSARVLRFAQQMVRTLAHQIA